MNTWKDLLSNQIDPKLAQDIDVFETQIELKKQGKVEDKLFAETRLRRGAYGQRYDNGQRHDGIAAQTLTFPSKEITKGPETMWDAPGMLRIKIPYGGLSADQMDILADLAEEYSDSISHITTRQDIQLHYIHIDDTPTIMRRLASVGITTQEACGNSVRNVTACPIAGICREQVFDVTPYAKACSQFLLGHPDAQDFGRKVKPAFSGCAGNACGLVSIHDLGFIARTRLENGVVERGFEMYVGGGLGAVPYPAKLFDSFVSETEILPLSQAICRVFGRLGEKKNRSRARLKFLVDQLGIEEFRRLVQEERKILTHDPAWTEYLNTISDYEDHPLKPSTIDPIDSKNDPDFEAWRATNVYVQRQPGYIAATVTLPLGDISSYQLRQLAAISRRYIGDQVRATVDQNLILRWINEADLANLYKDLKALNLGAPGAGTIVDVTACPGTDTCKLGIASSRGLASELYARLAAKSQEFNGAIRGLHIKISGCFNSCAQHHLADLGFYGVSRKVKGITVPHFRVVLGGQWENNGGSYGLTIGAVPSRNIPEFITRITDQYLKERQKEESFLDYTQRIGKKALKVLVDEVAVVPSYEEDSSYYSDWHDPREFSISDIGRGECAGEVVSRADFDLQSAERIYFEAQLKFDDSEFKAADEKAFAAMLEAAKGLIRTQNLDITDDPDAIVEQFRKRFYDTGLIQDKYAGGKFAQYIFQRHADKNRQFTQEGARHLIEEAQLFLEAVYACHSRLLEQPVAPLGLLGAAGTTPQLRL